MVKIKAVVALEREYFIFSFVPSIQFFSFDVSFSKINFCLETDKLMYVIQEHVENKHLLYSLRPHFSSENIEYKLHREIMNLYFEQTIHCTRKSDIFLRI